MRRAIQLLDYDGSLHALCDDGTMFVLGTNGWSRIEPIPQDGPAAQQPTVRVRGEDEDEQAYGGTFPRQPNLAPLGQRVVTPSTPSLPRLPDGGFGRDIKR